MLQENIGSCGIRKGNVCAKAIGRVALKDQLRNPGSPEENNIHEKMKIHGIFREPSKMKNKMREVPTSAESKKKVAQRSTILIQVAKRKTYATVLEKFRKKVHLDALHTRVVPAGSIKKGDLSIEIGGIKS